MRSARRKSIGIYVREGGVTVRAPTNENTKTIEQFVLQKQEWIQSHLQKQQSLLRKTQHSFTNDDVFYWLNTPLKLQVVPGRPANVQFTDTHIHVTCANPNNTQSVQRLVENGYRTYGLHWVQTRIDAFLQKHGNAFNKRPGKITLRRYKTRWGSCSGNGNLQFNWLILMAPKTVVDYVIAHELSHLKHFNHSTAFWQQVAKMHPNYLHDKHWLKHQTQLAWPNNDRD